MKLYVSGPYTANTEEEVLDNVHKALDVGIALIKAGHHPFIPHLTHWIEKRAQRTLGEGMPYEWYLQYDRYWLTFCDALYYLAPSPGADLERGWALELGLPVYTRLADVPAPAA